MISDDAANAERVDRRIVTVFFSDIAGFTSISEELAPGAIVNLLNNYFSAVTAPIRASNGIVDKYMGDGVMAFWSPPFSEGDSHAASACRAAIAQQDAVDRLNRELPHILGLRRGAPSLYVRMGIATGEAIVGTMGSATSKTFTVMGDTVNLASRLEGANKIYGTKIIVTAETAALAEREFAFRELDLITVAGKTEPVQIYEVLGARDSLDPRDAELRDTFASGLEAYRAQDWTLAERQFQSCLEFNPKDGPSRTFAGRIAQFRKKPPPPGWDGVWRLADK